MATGSNHPKHNQAYVATLPSGLLLAGRRWAGAGVEYCGVVVRAGSRDDAPDQPGMAHFVEHTIFKGTEKRSSWHIINRMERVGGELNAYTTKEETVVYTAAPAGNLARAMELIADLIASSRFPNSELDKEREVVADEINSYLDSPADAVYDDFEEIIFRGTPLGHNILGTVEALATFDSARCQRYLHRWYGVGNLCVFYCGSASAERVAATVEKAFAGLQQFDAEKGRRAPLCLAEGTFKKEKKTDTHQAHTVAGALVGGMHDPDRYAQALLANMLGGPGMNSLLNVALREKRGLVYSVEASTSLLSDCGLFTIYYGCDPADTGRCEALVRSQVEALADKGVTDRALAQAKKQYLGQLAVAADNRENAAINTGRAALYYGDILTAQQVAERFKAVTADQIKAAAQRIAPLSILTLH